MSSKIVNNAFSGVMKDFYQLTNNVQLAMGDKFKKKLKSFDYKKYASPKNKYTIDYFVPNLSGMANTFKQIDNIFDCQYLFKILEGFLESSLDALNSIINRLDLALSGSFPLIEIISSFIDLILNFDISKILDVLLGIVKLIFHFVVPPIDLIYELFMNLYLTVAKTIYFIKKFSFKACCMVDQVSGVSFNPAPSLNNIANLLTAPLDTISSAIEPFLDLYNTISAILPVSRSYPIPTLDDWFKYFDDIKDKSSVNEESKPIADIDESSLPPVTGKDFFGSIKDLNPFGGLDTTGKKDKVFRLKPRNVIVNNRLKFVECRFDRKS